jgi:hypothetical protein
VVSNQLVGGTAAGETEAEAGGTPGAEAAAAEAIAPASQAGVPSAVRPGLAVVDAGFSADCVLEATGAVLAGG